ncbi:MAG TPA: 2Fe-2S iron-sulfur cluster-binding protein [Gemmatimonadaceae bacterium]|jgi:NADH-quinone oxidoreductase subunit G|nr:2Fe-2S iron-sulfur cluster-binding protein [Gemmatimonadaceae bacterium]
MADQKMISLTIEGRTVSVPEGTSILEASKVAGVLVPHYCYHPGLPVAAVCRMCLVEVEKMPKLAPSCATAVAEGQVVHVHSERAREARKGVLEFLLINHPLDCPICDQSGECELQDYTFAEGRKDSRFLEPKRFNPVEDFGGDVIYVPNRCILCTRCVRFMDTVAKDTVLNVSERGDRALIGKFEGKDLTHAWAGNVIDLCPVGALLSKDSLNKARAWELDRTASICTGCSQGCNMIIETRDNVVVRQRPRPNADVNEFFLCDYGRLNYRWLNRQDRAEFPMVRLQGNFAPADWEVALESAASLLNGRRAHVVASPGLSNEALFLLKQLVDRTGGTGVFRVRTGPEAPLPGVEDLALRADRAPNVTGAELLGFTRTERPFQGLGAGEVLVVADDDLDGLDVPALDGVAGVIVIGTTLPLALANGVSILLPIANVAEEEGTFTNLRGRVQRFLQAKAAPALARPSWFVLGDLVQLLGSPAAYYLASEVFAALAAAQPEFRGLSYERLGLRGLPVLDAAAEAAAGVPAEAAR